jgi:hypothetical protein
VPLRFPGRSLSRHGREKCIFMVVPFGFGQASLRRRPI